MTEENAENPYIQYYSILKIKDFECYHRLDNCKNVFVTSVVPSLHICPFLSLLLASINL